MDWEVGREGVVTEKGFWGRVCQTMRDAGYGYCLCIERRGLGLGMIKF